MAEEEEADHILLQKNLFPMMEYETQLFLDIIHQDALVVAAKGLSMDHILLNLFKVYADPGNLVIILNCSEFEEKYYCEKLQDENIHATTYTTNVTEREDVYLSGGVHFVTTRILVVDLLKKRIPIDKITGFIVLQAHRVLESCQEAFVLRLYRQANKTGFVKAFTNSVQSFTIGFNHVERVMRSLFVKDLQIWPRFHSSVIQSLKKHEPQVVELHIPISDKMRKLQTCILDLMNLTVKELKNMNRTLEMAEITVENCLTKKFHKVLQTQLDCIWHQLSTKSKQLVTELKTLRHLLLVLFYNDAITFYSTLMNYRTQEYARRNHWVFLQPAEMLFTQANSLIYGKDKELNPEFCSKWHVLSEILRTEIPAEIKSRKMSAGDSKVLVLCQDSKSCFQLNQFLRHGPLHYLFLIALSKGINFKSLHKKFKTTNCKELQESFTQHQLEQSVLESSSTNIKSKNKNIPSKKPKLQENIEDSVNVSKYISELDELENMRDSYVLKMSESVLNDEENELNEADPDESKIPESQVVFEACPEMENMNLTQLLENLNQPTVLIQTFKHGDNFLSLQKTLDEIAPNFIIMYHSNITAVRQIEIYEARRQKDRQLKVFFLIHGETVEEQSYLTSLRREKEAFEFLIETKSNMVIPEDQDGKTDDCLALQREMKSPETNTRKAGGLQQGNQERNFVIVDMREFRSDLPSLIHKRGLEIEPLTISVGDYILTKDICVERKSLSDLVGSLNSGRLYQQCTQMGRCYAKPMLLIEFDHNRPFAWQSNFMVSCDGNNFDIQQKLLLLTMHFPRLKLIWSPSPYASAQLFEELKDGKDQPNIQYASTIGSEIDLDLVETKYNVAVYDFVQKLPGISSKNIDILLRNYKNLDSLCAMSQDELHKLLCNANDAKALYSILNEEQVQPVADTQQNAKKSTRSKFKFNKK